MAANDSGQSLADLAAPSSAPNHGRQAAGVRAQSSRSRVTRRGRGAPPVGNPCPDIAGARTGTGDLAGISPVRDARPPTGGGRQRTGCERQRGISGACPRPATPPRHVGGASGGCLIFSDRNLDEARIWFRAGARHRPARGHPLNLLGMSMSQTDDDLDRAILSDFLLGRLSGAEEEQARLRLEADARWQALALEIDDNDALVRSVRQVSDTPLPADPAPLRDLIGRLERLREPAAETADFVASPATATPAPSPVAYSFLRPPEQANELGCLGGFRIISPLGAGGMGLVFEAEDPQLQRRVAVKVMNPALASDPRHRQRFLREARAAAALRHDHIIDIYQVGEDQGVPFFAIPLLDGESLEDRLRR